MIDVALLSVIRRWHLRDGMSIREVARRSGLSRITVRKYLANGVVEPNYSRRKNATKMDAFGQSCPVGCFAKLGEVVNSAVQSNSSMASW